MRDSQSRRRGSNPLRAAMFFSIPFGLPAVSLRFFTRLTRLLQRLPFMSTLPPPSQAEHVSSVSKVGKRLRRTFWALVGFGLLATVGVATACWVLLQRTPGHYFDADGVRLFYTDRGTGEPVILLHGFGVNADLNWRITGVAPYLEREFRVIALDQRGFGLSDTPTDPRQYGAEMARDVVRLMDHLGIEKAHVAGYSLGGYVALKLAVMYPERLRSVACLGAGWQDPSRPDTEALFASFERFARQLESGHGVEPLSVVFGQGVHQATLFHRLQVKLVTTFLGNKKALAALVRSVRDLSVTREELQALEVPLLVVCGDRDPNFVSAQALREAKPECTFVPVSGRSHPGTAMSQELRSALHAFLREH